jgi:protein O-mannosyl-transferase
LSVKYRIGVSHLSWSAHFSIMSTEKDGDAIPIVGTEPAMQAHSEPLTGAGSVSTGNGGSNRPWRWLKWLQRMLLRPSLWTMIAAIAVYWDTKALHGDFVYDDAGSVNRNVVVNGKVPWKEVFIRDYWGELMSTPHSHKSYRPVTTLTFKLNWWVAENWLKVSHGTPNFTYSFHVVNVLLHGFVTFLVTEACMFFWTDTTLLLKRNEKANAADVQRIAETVIVSSIISGLMFALHPVHAESVSNITSRGELLMSIFYMLAFLSYSYCIPRSMADLQNFRIARTLGIYVAPWLCMTLSLFAKEQGATALICVVAYDGIRHYGSIGQFIWTLVPRGNASSASCANPTGERSPSQERSLALSFLRRAVILAAQTVLVCALRYWLNGESSPDFIVDQNPAGFARDRFTRAFSVTWVYCLYIRDALYPVYLAPDWSGRSIPLIENWNDWRVPIVISLWATFAVASLALVTGFPRLAAHPYERIRRQMLIALFAFFFMPFLLSSNIFVVVGLMKADRVIYLPLLGYCLLLTIVVQVISGNLPAGRKNSSMDLRVGSVSINVYVLLLLQFAFFSLRVHERNIAWSSQLHLWMSAYTINPRSRHTVYNCGYELSLKLRYAEAERVLREIGSPYVEGPSNTFVYCMVLYNLNRCDEAHKYLDDAMVVLDQKRKSGGLRYTESATNRVESNLLVARAMCTHDQNLPLAGQIMFNAVQKDPTNEYAIMQATAMAKRIEQLELMKGF